MHECHKNCQNGYKEGIWARMEPVCPFFILQEFPLILDRQHNPSQILGKIQGQAPHNNGKENPSSRISKILPTKTIIKHGGTWEKLLDQSHKETRRRFR